MKAAEGYTFMPVMPQGIARFPIAFLFLIGLLYSTALYGQEANEAALRDRLQRFHVGGKIGPSGATLAGPDADRDRFESTYKLAYAIHLFGRMNLATHWALQTELAYATRGSGVEIDGEARVPFDFSYGEFSLIAHTRWPLTFWDDRLVFHGLLGPSVDYVLYAGEADREFTDDVDRLDIGLHAGIGFSFELPYGNPVVEARYYHGLLDPFEPSGLDESHRTISVLVGYEVALPFGSGRQARSQ